MPLKLPQKITYWLPLTDNGTGGKTWSAGQVIFARTSSVHELFFNDEGKEVLAHEAVYTTVAMPTGSYIAKTEHLGVVAPVATAQMVIKSSSSPSITNLNRMLL